MEKCNVKEQLTVNNIVESKFFNLLIIHSNCSVPLAKTLATGKFTLDFSNVSIWLKMILKFSFKNHIVLKCFKVPMKWKIIAAYLTGFLNNEISFFVLEILAFYIMQIRKVMMSQVVQLKL